MVCDKPYPSTSNTYTTTTTVAAPINATPTRAPPHPRARKLATYTHRPPPSSTPPSVARQTDRTSSTPGNGTDQLYPFFDYYVPRNITTTIGQSAFLHCRTENLNDKSVSDDRTRCEQQNRKTSSVYLVSETRPDVVAPGGEKHRTLDDHVLYATRKSPVFSELGNETTCSGC
ncbi:hypothetical protein QTP88_016453 [Uroleucon formosanum]